MADITGMLQAAAGVGGAEEADPNFNQTVLLLHGDGTNGAQNNTFLDSSTNNFTITRNGNTTQGTFSPFSVADGAWSNYFDGTGDYLSVADNAALEIGASSFCIEAWIYLDALPATNTNQAILGKWSSGAFSYIFQIGDSSGTKRLLFSYSTDGSAGTTLSRDITITAGSFNHVAVTRDSTTVRFFVNGVEQGATQTASATFYNGAAAVNVGRHGSNINYFKGYISNCRLVIADAVYTSSFTPSTSPLTAISNTQLLTCQSNRFVDNSSNAFAITVAGNTSVQPFSPFAPSAAYSPSVNGGSGYFDGSGDNLTIPDNNIWSFAGDFTLEAFIYRTVGSVNQFIFTQSDNASAPETAWFLSINTSNKLYSGAYKNGSTFALLTSTANVPINAWTHVALVRTGTTLSQYINGVRDGTNASFGGQLNNSTQTVAIGARNGATDVLTGYINGARIISGSGPYDATSSTLTIPTAPLTAVTNTELLLNFTNAGIFDQTGKNNLETVGNAQIDTTTKKFGTGSMEFDGTGDWLKVPNSADIQLGTGDFTIEFWVYLASGDTGSNRGLVAKGGASTGWLVSLNTTEKVVFTYTTSTITSSGAITTNAWNHIAVVREGTGSNETKIYIGGTNDGTGTVSTNFNQTEVMYIGANRAAGDPMKGFIDDLRITKGVARYTTTFTPPTAAFPDL